MEKKIEFKRKIEKNYMNGIMIQIRYLLLLMDLDKLEKVI